MSKNKIDVKAGYLFPWPFRFVAAILMIVAISFIVEKTTLSIGLVLVSAFILSGYEGTEIDKDENIYREYTSFFLVKSGKKIKYTEIEKMFINSSKTEQRLYTAHTNHSSTFTNMVFNGYLKFNDGSKVHLLKDRKKERLIKTLKKFPCF